MSVLKKTWALLDIGSVFGGSKEIGIKYLLQVLRWDGSGDSATGFWIEASITPGVIYGNFWVSPNFRFALQIWRLNVLTVDFYFVKDTRVSTGGLGGGTPPGDGPSDPLES